MRWISHRGNLLGPNESEENHPDYINHAISKGYDVEIDVWYIKNEFYLGHDSPQYKVTQNFLSQKNLWLHSKNLDALERLVEREYNCFWHQDDKFTLTNHGYIWAYPTKYYPPNVIAVLPELHESNMFSDCAGVCSDYIQKYKEKYVANK